MKRNFRVFMSFLIIFTMIFGNMGWMLNKDTATKNVAWAEETVQTAVYDAVYSVSVADPNVPDDFTNDLWLNTNFQILEVNDTYQLTSRRVPEIIDGPISNNVSHPDYTYKIIKGDSVTLQDTTESNMTITAVKEGTSIIEVGYDATTANGKEYGAVSKVNKSYMVVDVVADKDVDNGITLDTDISTRSYDTIYYSEGDTVDYSFNVRATGSDDVEVTCNGNIVEGSGNEYTVALENRSNIIGITAIKGENKEKLYYVIDARKIEVKIENNSRPDEDIAVGDEVKVSFRGIISPVYKLATIYNPTWYAPNGMWGATYGTTVRYNNSDLGEVVTYDHDQYDLYNHNAIKFTVTEEKTYKFTNGHINSEWWGSPLGTERDMSGPGEPNLDADVLHDDFSILPDFEVIVGNGSTNLPVADPNVPDDFTNDLWLNTNFQILEVNDTYQLTSRRVPEIIDGPISNNVSHPDYTYKIIKGDSVTLQDTTESNMTITAVKEGTSIIEVGYDATTANGKEYGAVSKVNKSYMVVDVVADKDVDNGITLDTDISTRSYDTIYYSEGDTVDYSFNVRATGSDDVEVTCNGNIVEGSGNEYTVALENRSNIIGITAIKGENKEKLYYVIDARKIEVKIENNSRPDEDIAVGDEVKVSFRGIISPVYKLATIYNPTWYAPNGMWGATYGTTVRYNNSDLGEVVTYDHDQYDLYNHNAIKFTVTEEKTYKFTNGHINSEWWGSPLGTERDMSGPGEPNLDADVLHDDFSILPDFEVIVGNGSTNLPVADPNVPDDFTNDLWLNTNFQILEVNDTYQLTSRRVPEIIDGPISNNVSHPDYTYKIIKGDSVTLQDTTESNMTITAVKEGTSIIEVGYDATTANGKEYGAVSKVNKSYMVVDVVADKDVDNGITLDTDISTRSYDTIYYSEGDTVDYSFNVRATGSDDVEVTCNGNIVEGSGNEYTVALENRSNIIGITAIKGENKEKLYYVIDARKIEVKIENNSRPDEDIAVGDEVKVSFRGIISPVYKLATIYNPTWYAPNGMWGATYGTTVRYNNSDLGEVVTYDHDQYDLYNHNAIKFTVTEEKTYKFTNGHINSEWWGSPLGTERDMSGPGEPNLDADVLHDDFSILPDFEVIVGNGSTNLPVADPNVPDDFTNDLWLNTNFQILEVNDTYQLTSRRVPEIIDGPISNNVSHPDYTYKIIKGDSVTLQDTTESNMTITAVKEGTSIIEVGYDATTANGKEYGAVSKVNKSYMVVDVVADKDVDNGITLDTDISTRSYDTIYYSEGDTVDYSFNVRATGSDDVEVTCNGNIVEGSGNEYTVALENRSNIIGITAIKGENKEKLYYVIDARKIEVKIENNSRPDEDIAVGDEVKVSFRGIISPVYKLATIYNPTWYAPNGMWGATYGTTVRYNNSDLGEVVTYDHDQYDLYNHNAIKFTVTEEKTYKFTNGHINSEWWGSPLGTERDMSGPGEPNLDANVLHDDFSILPDFEVVVGKATTIPESDKDIIAPDITTDLESKTVQEAKLSFTVSANDDKDGKVIPSITLNDQSVEGKDGNYVVTLNNGDNTILVKVTDQAGNKAEKRFIIIYQKDEDVVIPPTKKSIKVDIRIEGNKETIIDKTKVYLNESDLDLKQYNIDRNYENYTTIHPTVKVLEKQGVRYEFDKKYNYNFLTMIDGLRMNGINSGKDGWMYFINNRYADRGLSEYSIKDGDSIVWFFTEDYTKNHFAWFDQEEVKVSAGDKITLRLQGRYHNMNSGQSSTKGIEGATILVNNNKWKSNEGFVKTDEDGKATIIFNRAGTYHVSAERFDGSIRDISRPYCKIIVEGKAGNEDKGEYGDEENIINDPNGSEKDITNATKQVADKLDKKANAIKSEKDAQNVVKDAKDVAKIMEKAAERVSTEEGAKNVAKESVKIVNNLIKSAEKLTKDSDKKEVSEAATENMKATMKVMDKINDTKEVNKVAGDLINIAGKLIKQLGNKNAKEVIESTVKVAEKAVVKASVKEIDKDKIKVEKEKVVATVDEAIIKEMAKNTVATVKAIKEKLKENGFETKQAIENKVTIEIPKTDKKEVEAKLPANMMKTLKENGIEKAAIKTETAVFNLTPNTFGENEKDQAVSLGAKEIDRNMLTPLERNKVPKGCIVVDLDAKIGEEKISNFNEPIAVSIPYKGEVKEGEVVQVFFLNDNGIIESRGGAYDPAKKMVTFTTPHFSKYFAKKVDKTEIQVTEVTFKDLGDYEWAKEAIEAMATNKIINGRSDEKFDPSANITRAEFATLVTKMMGYTTENMDIPFIDVEKDTWYYDFVGVAYKNGLINGRSENVFDPNGNITRQEMAVILAKVLDKSGYSQGGLSELDIFKDANDIASWSKNSVSLCVKEKIISGMDDGNFAPKQNANRAQAAAMLYKVYQLIVK
ncbi:S-layer homology domain-containing protein [Crassaminicella profunda]|uniref:S-layer homology domain-containing protein n=1 Tax=Crassaminicella profunda TaxID=1286698 RepID=UPI001CA690A7|nr:S-layer homology domain-containing protein [Crassaminicella profunda]QZY55691.1 S-layer homology domain-containing protein [Crassaminicella profunda]